MNTGDVGVDVDCDKGAGRECGEARQCSTWGQHLELGARWIVDAGRPTVKCQLVTSGVDAYYRFLPVGRRTSELRRLRGWRRHCRNRGRNTG